MAAPAAALNAEELFALIKGDLKPYVEGTLSGIFSEARDPFEVIELLGEAPGRFRVILAWDGENPAAGTLPISGIGTHKLKVVVSHNRGLSILRGVSLHAAEAGRPSLMTLTRQVRDRLRTLLFSPSDTSRRLAYQGATPIRAEIEGKATQLDAYELNFELTAALTRFAAEDFRVAA